jgi:quercetin 2,3-dioxygenase
MITIRKSHERGHFDHEWLDTYHTFSFADYYDPDFMGFRTLRVINDDRVAAGRGFGTHGHRDMEIVTYVIEGALAHRDSMGSGSIIHPGEVQRMSAGTGVMHSEFNHAQDQTTHFLQIWIEPDERGIEPGYEQKSFAEADKRGRLRLVASPDGEQGSVRIHADARMHAGLFDAGESATLALDPQRPVYVHLVRGELSVNGKRLAAGDAAKLRGEPALTLDHGKDAEVLVFDLSEH